MTPTPQTPLPREHATLDHAPGGTTPAPAPAAATPSGAARAPRPPLTLPAAAGWPFLVTAFVGRMPSSMVQLGYLMVLSSGGRGMAAAGLAVAAVGLGTALLAPVLGRLVDQVGPVKVVGGATLLSCLAQAAFLLLLLRHAPTWALLVCAGIVGAANPQVGPVARSRWSHLARRLGQPGLVQRALGYEGAVDEIGFVVGPVLAGALVTALGAHPATVAMLLLTLLLQGLFVLHLARHRDEWSTAASHPDGTAGSVPVQTSPRLDLVWPMLGCLGVGTLFGATQTALTALFELRGQPGVTGVVYACVGVGSGVASLLAGRLPRRIGAGARLGASALVVLAGALWMLTLPAASVAWLPALVLGLGAGVTLVSSFSWMERIAPRHRVATMMTVLATCITLGVSGGAAFAGRLSSVPAHGFWPVLASGVLVALGAVGMVTSRHRG